MKKLINQKKWNCITVIPKLISPKLVGQCGMSSNGFVLKHRSLSIARDDKELLENNKHAGLHSAVVRTYNKKISY